MPHRDEYKTIFDQRAKDYIKALNIFPDIRRDEFNNFIKLLQLKENENFLDAPCGTGICAAFINKSIQYTGLDPCATFANYGKNNGLNTVQANMEQQIFPQNNFDVIGSLAGVHHISDRKALYSEWYRILKPRGRLIVLDVREASRPSSFLNDFVDQYNSMGHQGLFLNDDDIKLLNLIGFKDVKYKEIESKWIALNKDTMCTFMRTMFTLDKLKNNLLLSAELNRDFQTIETDWSYQLIWPLTCITAIKN